MLIYYIIKYRRDIVAGNLRIAFPEKTAEERIRIAKEFYHNLIDTFVETIKLFSISEKELNKRCTTNIEVVNELFKTGKNIHLLGGHFFNWEIINFATTANLRHPMIAVYMPLKNKAINRLLIKLRSKFGSVLVATTEFKTVFHHYAKKPYALGLVADQNAGHTGKAYWVSFFGKMVPFIRGPEKGARSMDTCVVMTNFYKVKRGYYKVEYSVLTTNPNEMKEGEITKQLIAFIENCIRSHPSNYLWSHRRWRWDFHEAKHGHLAI